MKTLAVLMVLLVGCADALPGDDAADGPVSGAGGAAAGTGGAQGPGGQYVPDPAPDCPTDTNQQIYCAYPAITLDRSGNECLFCTGDVPPGGCAIRKKGQAGADILCVPVGLDCLHQNDVCWQF